MSVDIRRFCDPLSSVNQINKFAGNGTATADIYTAGSKTYSIITPVHIFCIKMECSSQLILRNANN